MSDDILVFTEETLSWQLKNKGKPFKISMDPGTKESGLLKYRESTLKEKEGMSAECKTVVIIYYLLQSCRVFQFHDTSKEAKIRNSGYIEDHDYLKSDGGNLAAFLYAMKLNSDGQKYYNRIVRYIQQIMPQFGDFVLKPSAKNENYILLNWKENDSDYLFGPHQISDGALRFMALAALLLQPEKTLPSVVIIDEPELGLHPSAISILVAMIRLASRYCQVILATQSPALVDEFDVENILIVERDKQEKRTVFKQKTEEELKDWLERYSMSELWEKNILGGRP